MNTPHRVEVRLGETPYIAEVRAGSHAMICDVDPTLGGRDTGPDPHALLLGALGTCTAMTVKMYADRKGWAVSRVACAAQHDETRDDAGPVHRFIVTLTIEGDLDDEQRARLLDIAHRCPIHRALVGRKTIELVTA